MLVERVISYTEEIVHMKAGNAADFFSREGLPVIGSVRDSIACSILSETSILTVPEGLGFLFFSVRGEICSSIDHLV